MYNNLLPDGLYIKYMTPENFRKLKKGNLHFNTLKYFQDDETKGKNTTIGDKHEGQIIKNIPANEIQKLKIATDNSEFNITRPFKNGDNGYAARISLIPEESKSDRVFCFSILNPDDNEICECINVERKLDSSTNTTLVEKTYREKKSFVEKLYNEVGEDNRIPVMLLPSFFEKADKYFKENNLQIALSPVEYYSDNDKSNVDTSMPISKQAMFATFQKNKRYASQKEGRFVSFYKSDKSDINIGDLSDDVLEISVNKPRFQFTTVYHI